MGTLSKSVGQSFLLSCSFEFRSESQAGGRGAATDRLSKVKMNESEVQKSRKIDSPKLGQDSYAMFGRPLPVWKRFVD